MKLMVYHRIAEDVRAHYAQLRMEELAAGKSDPTPALSEVGFTVLESPFPACLLRHADEDDDGNGWINLYGTAAHGRAPLLGVADQSEDERGVCTFFAPGAQPFARSRCPEKLWGYRKFAYRRECEPLCLVSGARYATAEEIATAVEAAEMTDEDRRINAEQDADREAFVRAVRDAAAQIHQDWVAHEGEIRRQKDEAWERLKGWAKANGSELLRHRVELGFEWKGLSEVEWTRALAALLLPPLEEMHVINDKISGWKTDPSRTPSLAEMQTLVEYRDKIGSYPEGDGVELDLYWCCYPKPDGERGRETLLSFTAKVPTGGTRTIYFRLPQD